MKLFHFKLKEMLLSLVITSILYVIFFYFFPESVRHAHLKVMPIALDIIAITLSLLFSWRLNNIFSAKFDKHYRWEEKPVTRLITQLVITSVVAFFVVIAFMVPNAMITNHFYPELIDNLKNHNVIMQQFTYYFIGILILFQSVYISGNFYKRWISSSLETQKLKYENVHAHLHALQNQAQPHFLFNTLNTLTSLIEEDPKTAVIFVQQFAKFYRYLLQREEHHLVHLDEELQFVYSYIYLQKKRFGESLQIELNICEKCAKKNLPVFALLILFENAVKHNIVSAEQPLCIKVSCKEDMLTVENNLQKKISALPSNGYGLSNLVNRYKLLDREDIIIEENERVFRISVPLIRENISFESINN